MAAKDDQHQGFARVSPDTPPDNAPNQIAHDVDRCEQLVLGHWFCGCGLDHQ